MPPRVRLGRAHGRSNTPRHEIQAGADLSPRQPALRRSHKFTALTEFCKRLNKFAIITLSAASLFSMVLPAATYAQDCAGLRWACENKDQLGLQGAGTCRRY